MGLPSGARRTIPSCGKIRPDSQNPAAFRGFFDSPETPRISPKIPLKSRNYPDWLQKQLEFPEKPGPCCSVCKPAQRRPGTPFEDVPGRVRVRIQYGFGASANREDRNRQGSRLETCRDQNPHGSISEKIRDPRGAKPARPETGEYPRPAGTAKSTRTETPDPRPAGI